MTKLEDARTYTLKRERSENSFCVSAKFERHDA